MLARNTITPPLHYSNSPTRYFLYSCLMNPDFSSSATRLMSTKVFGSALAGFGVFQREVVEHGFHTIRRRVGHFGKSIRIGDVGALQSLGIADAEIFLE